MYEDFFKNKKITVMGLGLLGRGLGVIRFLAKHGADLVVTDFKTRKQLSYSLNKLKKLKNIKYVLGKHRLIDFKNKDMIIKAAGVPLDSIYIQQAKKNKIPIEMDASLFVKLADIKLVGITGTNGKSTVTRLIYYVLKEFYLKSYTNVFLGGNVKGIATLPFLERVKKNDIVVLELDSWQLQGFNDSKISPNISVFTNFLPDHLNYYRGDMDLYFKDKTSIFKYQNKNDYLIIGNQAYKEIKKRFKKKIKSKIIKADIINFKTKLIGKHNQKNISLAFEVLKLFGINNSFIKKKIMECSGEPGRLELIRKHNEIEYYNDNNATTPDSVIVALDALYKNKRNIILLAGGSDKGLEYSKMAEKIHKTVKALILFNGKASNDIVSLLPNKKDYSIDIVNNMKHAIKKIKEYSKKGDIVLLSPGSASFGIFKNEYNRGDQFVNSIKRL